MAIKDLILILYFLANLFHWHHLLQATINNRNKNYPCKSSSNKIYADYLPNPNDFAESKKKKATQSSQEKIDNCACIFHVKRLAKCNLQTTHSLTTVWSC